ncbi:hypothetical protein ACJU26_05880 [Acidithiobacillus sp. M4-SHS-6]|uniref:hypothetical protein n=1 Tax=Acidithiobacillus sp. M4-SHS-6 TaxID=3383024 RepID=UPI0039BE3AFB
MREMEPAVGKFVRFADPERDHFVLQAEMEPVLQAEEWPALQRGGYLLDLLVYFSPHQDAWQPLLLPWLDEMVQKKLPKSLPLLAFFPRDSRQNPADALAARWRLSSGVLYDRLQRLLVPPHVC